MRTDLLSHPGSGRDRAVPVPDSERELKPLKVSLKVFPSPQANPYKIKGFDWRRGSESVERLFFTDSLRPDLEEAIGYTPSLKVARPKLQQGLEHFDV